MFTEHDYVDKVLNMSHSAVQTSKVSEVASMGSDLVVAYPEDTVAGCLEVMTIKVPIYEIAVVCENLSTMVDTVLFHWIRN